MFLIVVRFVLCWGAVVQGLVQADRVPPMDPVHGRQFDLCCRCPVGPCVNVFRQVDVCRKSAKK